MAKSVNKVILIGNLGDDPKTSTMSNGNPVVNLSIATSESWKDKATGERKEKTEWHRVVVFDENICWLAGQYLRKGSKVYLEGQLQTRSYEKDGITRYSTEIVLQRFKSALTMLGGKPEGNGYQQQQEGAGSYNGLNDEIPF